jgi:homoserine kinase
VSFESIAVPGSISNLGPAFDTLAVAVQLYVRVRILEVRPSRPDRVEIRFPEGPPPGEDRVWRAFRHARERIGLRTPGIVAEVSSEVPPRAGLGSSGAATVAGLRLYEAVTGARPALDWLAMSCEIEGHPDNAAASLLGGMSTSCQHDDGRVTARAWRWPSAIRFVVATPDVAVATAHARSVLPASVRLRDAVFNMQRALLLMHALDTGQHEDVREGLRDRWHQPARAPLVPGLEEALTIEHPSVLGVCLSGAGPSVVALVTGDELDVAALLGGVYDRLRVPYTIRMPAVHQPAVAASPAAAEAWC